MASLSDTFQDLDSETFTETTTPSHITHQTVLYQWRLLTGTGAVALIVPQSATGRLLFPAKLAEH
jgi:hypothetical protein